MEMITYRFRETHVLWDFDLVHTKMADGRLSVIKDSFRLKPDVAVWLAEKQYPYTTNSQHADISFENPDHAFDFKMRWV
jgi:hypothetical protein